MHTAPKKIARKTNSRKIPPDKKTTKIDFIYEKKKEKPTLSFEGTKT